MTKLFDSKGTIFGVGLGPGSPDLMSVRAYKLVRNARNIAFFRKAGRPGHARQIVNDILPSDVTEFAMEYPVTTEIPIEDPCYNRTIAAFYERWCQEIKSLVNSGEDLIILCEGDPFFYGSFMHIFDRLQSDCRVEIIPGISGMSGAWTATRKPITWGDDILTILVGTMPENELSARLSNTDAAVIMKVGRNIEKIKRALNSCGRYEQAYLVEYATMKSQLVSRLTDYLAASAPYFSIIVLHGEGRRP